MLADMGCRNTVFNAQAQSAARYLSQLARSGYRRFRIELVDETPEHVAPIANAYAAAVERAVSEVEARNDAEGYGHGNGYGFSYEPGSDAAEELMSMLDKIPDSNGRVMGCTEGSLTPKKEQTWASLRPTAATERTKDANAKISRAAKSKSKSNS